MKQTAIQKAIVMVRNRIDSQIDTLMGKHTIHHLQQVERLLYELLESEKEQIINDYESGLTDGLDDWYNETGEKYYKETYGDDT